MYMCVCEYIYIYIYIYVGWFLRLWAGFRDSGGWFPRPGGFTIFVLAHTCFSLYSSLMFLYNDK